MRKIKMAEAIREAIKQEMERDEAVFVMGEDIAVFGGLYGVTRGLLEEFGEERVRDTPISESGFVGAALGTALMGMRPIVEIQYADFVTCCMDPIINHAAKLRLMSGGQLKVPIVVRMRTGSANRGAQHGQSLEAWFMHTPGLKVVVPSTPYDAKGLLITAIRDDNPVIFFEHRCLYGDDDNIDEKKMFLSVPEEEYTIPFGQADIKREGKDVTVIATMLMVHKSLNVAKKLERDGISVEVVDPRTLTPLDKETILNSISKTNRGVIVTEDPKTGGVSAEIAAEVAEEAFFSLAAPIKRVAALDVPVPQAIEGERFVIPNENDIIAAIKEIL